jgi:hypothetical protein
MASMPRNVAMVSSGSVSVIARVGCLFLRGRRGGRWQPDSYVWATPAMRLVPGSGHRGARHGEGQHRQPVAPDAPSPVRARLFAMSARPVVSAPFLFD